METYRASVRYDGKIVGTDQLITIDERDHGARSWSGCFEDPRFSLRTGQVYEVELDDGRTGSIRMRTGSVFEGTGPLLSRFELSRLASQDGPG
jgi:hypothetical protein